MRIVALLALNPLPLPGLSQALSVLSLRYGYETEAKR